MQVSCRKKSRSRRGSPYSNVTNSSSLTRSSKNSFHRDTSQAVYALAIEQSGRTQPSQFMPIKTTVSRPQTTRYCRIYSDTNHLCCPLQRTCRIRGLAFMVKRMVPGYCRLTGTRSICVSIDRGLKLVCLRADKLQSLSNCMMRQTFVGVRGKTHLLQCSRSYLKESETKYGKLHEGSFFISETRNSWAHQELCGCKTRNVTDVGQNGLDQDSPIVSYWVYFGSNLSFWRPKSESLL